MNAAAQSSSSSSTTTPITTLIELLDAGASGELICVAPGIEIHVYLQAGRIAWATDSGAPFAFSRYLLEHFEITKETFQEVLESCRRDRLPLGETLIEWRLATLDQIREALHHQINSAIVTLRSVEGTGRAIFLERRFSTYDVRLTFDPKELMIVLPPPASPSTVRVRRRRQSEHRHEEHDDTLERARRLIPQATWLELLDGEDTMERDPENLAAATSAPVALRTVLDGASLVAIRTTRTATIGVQLHLHERDSLSLFCRIELDSTFGTTISALSALAGLPPTSSRGAGITPQQQPELVTRRHVVVSETTCIAVEELIARTPETLGVVVLDHDEAAFALAPKDHSDRLIDIARRRQRALTEPTLIDDDTPPSPDEELGYRLKSIVTREEDLWCFGAELATNKTLWMFIDPRTEQGLGWAYLTSLARVFSTHD
jgi:hypothetical protein